MTVTKKFAVLGLAAVMLAGAAVGCGRTNKVTSPTGAESTSEITVADTTAVDTTIADTTAVDTTIADTTAVDTTVADTTEDTSADTTAVETVPAATEGMFLADLAETALSRFDQYDECVLDDTTPVTKILFYTDGVVKDLQFYSLTDPSVDDNGIMSFTKTPIHSHDYITKNRPLLVTLTFYGDIPSYGVSVTDAVGDTVYFSIGMSGEDGSILLTEIK